jgi:hypothetical protein
MSKPFIHVDHKKYGDYARVFYPSWENKSKTVIVRNLGKVIDLENGIFKSRLRGTFKFNLEDGFLDDDSLILFDRANSVIQEESLRFGDIFTALEILKREELIQLFSSLCPKNEDTLLSLLFFRLLSDEPFINAYNWWNHTYAKILFPNASVTSQRISEFLITLGTGTHNQRFFSDYLKLIYKDNEATGIIIDSTGAPNDIRIDLTKINNHNGLITNEIRLIYVIDRIKKTPIYFRVVAGNIIDLLTLQYTVNELKAYNIGIKYSVLDAGYYSEDNIRFLNSNNINFVMRMVPNTSIAKELISKHIDSIIDMENRIMHNNRLLFVKKIPFIHFGRQAYAFIAVDHRKRCDEIFTLVNNNDNRKTKNSKKSTEELEKQSKTMGCFVLLSSLDLEIEEVLPYYSSRNYIEQIFDISKNNGVLLPLRVHSVDALMGHFLLNFLTVISYMKINSLLEKTRFSAKNMLYELGFLMGKYINDKIYVYEPNRSMKELLKLCQVQIPRIIDVKDKNCDKNIYY